jgi:CRISPR-associated protein Csm1
MSNRLEQSCRMALAALLHDLGKFAERARISASQETIDSNKHLYCPHHKAYLDAKGWFSHVHAAYTAIALDRLESHFPELKGQDMEPFASWKTADVDDSLINGAAKHHRPDTFLQWVIATADRVASGFEREEFDAYNQAREGTSTGKNHYTARQITLLEQIRLDGNRETPDANLKFRYRLKPLSPDSIFPVEAKGYEIHSSEAAQQEYRELWNGFEMAMAKIPPSHRSNLPLWLDHFETVWSVYSHAIPSATAGNVRPDVSLYDHSKTTAALATALWRYHHERNETGDLAVKRIAERDDWEQPKFLLIQGDFFGIQDFIFASGGETRKKAAKLLRGRSFFVSLLTECAALKVLDALDLPSTSQIVNAAGKFLIVAPNTEQTRVGIDYVQSELDRWFLQHSWGQAGVGLAALEASCNDFLKTQADDKHTRFQNLMKRLFEQLDTIKTRRFGLCNADTPLVFSDFLDRFNNQIGVCEVDGRSPAEITYKGVNMSLLAKDQIDIGYYLTRYQRLLITRQRLKLESTLGLEIFGYFIGFTENDEIRGKFGNEAESGNLLRCWDFSLPDSETAGLWNGYARRYINAYVPRFDEKAESERKLGKFKGVPEDDSIAIGDIKTLNYIACEDRVLHANGEDWNGVAALMTLKGDVDNLGLIFQNGLGAPTFAKMAALSRQMNAFFAIYLPWLCQSESQFKNTYTVFAGGDDFFLIGPWRSQIELAAKLREKFKHYVAENPEVHFSAGLSMTKPGLPIPHLADQGDDALDASKSFRPDKDQPAPKNAVNCFRQTMPWDEFLTVSRDRVAKLEYLTRDLALSTGYLYGLLGLVKMAENLKSKTPRPENALWHSWFAYRTRRLLERNRTLDETQRKKRQEELAREIANNGIEKHGGNYKVALFIHLYQQRD